MATLGLTMLSVAICTKTDACGPNQNAIYPHGSEYRVLTILGPYKCLLSIFLTPVLKVPVLRQFDFHFLHLFFFIKELLTYSIGAKQE